MRDTRQALPPGAELRFSPVCYTIKKEIGRGGSGIVYDASYQAYGGIDKTVRIKECFPCIEGIYRRNDGSLQSDGESNIRFQKAQEDMRRAFKDESSLFFSAEAANSLTNSWDLYEGNGTVYTVSTYMHGNVLADYRPKTLQECISIAKNTAVTVGHLHRHGYLYLDIKPENIFVLSGTSGLIQLFDFDTLYPLSEERGSDAALGFTPGFAALELRLGQIKKLGAYTDIYSIGALLFYQLFGRVPNALDCAPSAKQNYEDCLWGTEGYSDRLFVELDNFFQKTLANDYTYRCQSMDEAVSQLEKLQQLADKTVPYVISTPIVKPLCFVGRKKELRALEEWRNNPKSPCLFVTGMGGIGKSTLVREFLSQCPPGLVLYLHFNQSILDTVVDDHAVPINTVQKLHGESREEYFQRKCSFLSRLGHGKDCILVIDDFQGNADEELRKVINTGWKVLILSRLEPPAQSYPVLCVEALQNKSDLYTLFQTFCGTTLLEKDWPILDTVIEMSAGHTLTLELLARQAGWGQIPAGIFLTSIIDCGLQKLSDRKTPFVRDGITVYAPFGDILARLFSPASVSTEKRNILKVFSLMGNREIGIFLLADLLSLHSLDVLSELKAEGWLTIESGCVSLHSIVCEAIYKWRWSDESLTLLSDMMNHLEAKIQEEKAGGEAFYLAETILQRSDEDPQVISLSAYQNLLAAVLLVAPDDREDIVLPYWEKLFFSPSPLPKRTLFKIYDKVTYLYCAQGNFAQAEKTIRQAKERLQRSNDPELQARYYYLWAIYWDARMEAHPLLEALDKAIYHISRSQSWDKNVLLPEYLLSKATVLVRGYPEKESEIRKLLVRVSCLVPDFNKQKPSLERDFYLTCSWYFTYVRCDQVRVEKCLRQAQKIQDTLGQSDLETIDELLIPSANIMVELGETEKAKFMLDKCVSLCEKHQEEAPYIRKKQELYRCLDDIHKSRN